MKNTTDLMSGISYLEIKSSKRKALEKADKIDEIKEINSFNNFLWKCCAALGTIAIIATGYIAFFM